MSSMASEGGAPAAGDGQPYNPAHLFTQRIGNAVLPMSFYVPLHQDRAELGRLIMGHGGVVTSSYAVGGINLWFGDTLPRSKSKYYR
jgi:hypothetical protein